MRMLDVVKPSQVIVWRKRWTAAYQFKRGCFGLGMWRDDDEPSMANLYLIFPFIVVRIAWWKVDV